MTIGLRLVSKHDGFCRACEICWLWLEAQYLTPPLPVLVLCVPPAQEEEPEKYQAHFAKYIEAGVEPGEVEDLYKEVRHPAPAMWGRGGP